MLTASRPAARSQAAQSTPGSLASAASSCRASASQYRLTAINATGVVGTMRCILMVINATRMVVVMRYLPRVVGAERRHLEV